MTLRRVLSAFALLAVSTATVGCQPPEYPFEWEVTIATEVAHLDGQELLIAVAPDTEGIDSAIVVSRATTLQADTTEYGDDETACCVREAT
jgi:hypothetical protein